MVLSCCFGSCLVSKNEQAQGDTHEIDVTLFEAGRSHIICIYIYSSGINQWATFSHTLIVLFYLRLTDMEQAWKPSRVEPDSSQQDQYRPLYGHYRAMLVRDLQRLNTMYEGNRPIEIRLHHNSSDSFRLDPSGMRCACTCSHVTINCPPIAWQMKSPSITFL